MEKQTRANGSLLSIFIFVIFANVFFLHAFGTVALCLLTLGLWALVLHLFDRGNKETKRIKFLTGAILLTSLTLLLTVNSVEKVLLLGATSFVTMVVASYCYLKGETIGGILELGLSTIHMGLEYVRSGFAIIFGMLNGQIVKMLGLNAPLKRQSPWVKSVAIGVVVGIPVVAWLISTLSSADPIFATALHGIVSTRLLAEMPVRIIFSVFIFLVFLPLLVMKWRGYNSPLAWLTKVNFGREMAVVTGMIVLILGAFLAIQWPYVFVSVAREVDMSRFGVATYSEYVQRGFWDLLKVAGMVFGVTWIGYLLNKNQKGKEHQLLLGAQAILALEFAVFVVSIFRRVWIYQSFHGLSLARLYGMSLLVLLVGMMVTLGLRFVYKNVKWVKVEAAWILLIVFGTVAINMERLVVMDPPTVNGRVDYVYLSRLSLDGRQGWILAYNFAQETMAKAVEEPGILFREDRRDIYYSDMISRRLVNNYHELVIQYGTTEEVREYFKAIINATPGENKEKKLDVLDKDDLFDALNIGPMYSEYMFMGSYYGNDGIKVVPYYKLDGGFGGKRPTGVDKILAWNPSSNNAYQILKKEIGIEKLIKLQEDFMTLKKRVDEQPKSEQEFDVDVSFESPFLR